MSQNFKGVKHVNDLDTSEDFSLNVLGFTSDGVAKKLSLHKMLGKALSYDLVTMPEVPTLALPILTLGTPGAKLPNRGEAIKVTDLISKVFPGGKSTNYGTSGNQFTNLSHILSIKPDGSRSYLSETDILSTLINPDIVFPHTTHHLSLVEYNVPGLGRRYAFTKGKEVSQHNTGDRFTGQKELGKVFTVSYDPNDAQVTLGGTKFLDSLALGKVTIEYLGDNKESSNAGWNNYRILGYVPYSIGTNPSDTRYFVVELTVKPSAILATKLSLSDIVRCYRPDTNMVSNTSLGLVDLTGSTVTSLTGDLSNKFLVHPYSKDSEYSIGDWAWQLLQYELHDVANKFYDSFQYERVDTNPPKTASIKYRPSRVILNRSKVVNSNIAVVKDVLTPITDSTVNSASIILSPKQYVSGSETATRINQCDISNVNLVGARYLSNSVLRHVSILLVREWANSGNVMNVDLINIHNSTITYSIFHKSQPTSGNMVSAHWRSGYGHIVNEVTDIKIRISVDTDYTIIQSTIENSFLADQSSISRSTISDSYLGLINQATYGPELAPEATNITIINDAVIVRSVYWTISGEAPGASITHSNIEDSTFSGTVDRGRISLSTAVIYQSNQKAFLIHGNTPMVGAAKMGVLSSGSKQFNKFTV